MNPLTIDGTIGPDLEAAPPSASPARRRHGSLTGHAATFGLVIAVILVLAAAVLPVLTGGKAMTVLTGSMQPDLPPGHVAVYYPVVPEDLKPGDVIAYMPANNSTNGVPITHRITEIETDGGYVTTVIVQGDANRFPDRPLDPEQIIGKMAYYVPFVGLLRVVSFHLGLAWLQTFLSVGMIAGGLVLLIADTRKRRGTS